MASSKTSYKGYKKDKKIKVYDAQFFLAKNTVTFYQDYDQIKMPLGDRTKMKIKSGFVAQKFV